MELSELDFVRSEAVGQGESGSEISLKVLNFLDLFKELSINVLLDALEFGSPFAFSLFAFLDFLHSVLRGVLELVLGVSASALEERVVDVSVDTFDGHLLGSGNHVGGVDSSKRDAIDGVGSSDQKVA